MSFRFRIFLYFSVVSTLAILLVVFFTYLNHGFWEDVVFIIATVFFLGAMSWLISGIIIGPLNELNEKAGKISRGNMNLQLSSKILRSKDEIGELANSFASLMFKLRSFYEELEEKVKNRTRELEAEKVKDEALLSSIGDGVIAVDFENKIIFTNQVAEDMFGWLRNQMVGKIWDESFLPLEHEDGKIISIKEQPFVRSFFSGQKIHSILYFSRKNNTRFPIDITATPMFLDKKLIGTVVVMKDITAEREIDKAKTEFVSLASHQLRTPLSSINWYTEMLLAEDAGKINEDQKSYLKEIYKGSQRMIDLVNSLLNVSRVELGSLAVEPVPTNFGEVCDSVLAELKPMILEKKMQIETKYENPPMINADPKLIRIIFQNLLSNAVKYTPAEGKIRIIFEKQDKFLLIMVADNGYGIPRDQQSKIFTKLFRADNAREKDTDGTGLGLYLVKSIIEDAGGNIRFYSDENKGTIFYINFPLGGMVKKEGAKGLIEKKK